MNIIKLLFSISKKFFLSILFFSILTGVSCTRIITLINHILTHGTVDHYSSLLIQFLVSILVFGVSVICSEYLLIRFSNLILYNYRTDLANQILNSELIFIQKLEAHRILAILTEDLTQLTNTVSDLPSIIINIPILIGCYLYISTISIPLFITISCFLIMIFLFYKIPFLRARTKLKSCREVTNKLFKHFENLVYGVKELLQNKDKADFFLNENLCKDATLFKEMNNQYKFLFRSIMKSIDILVFIGIAFLLFLLPSQFDISLSTLNSFILVLVFMIGPINQSINFFTKLSQANVSLQHINLIKQLNNKNQNQNQNQNQNTDFNENLNVFFNQESQHITLSNITYSYKSKESAFNLGGLSVTIKANDITFITGGNGSGKTTFLKLITGLYQGDSGRITYGDISINPSNIHYYRSLFGVVFSDFHLFNQSFTLNEKMMRKIDHYLKEFKLDHIVSLSETGFSTLNVSQGQKKRLALIVELCCDKPIYVFDEWAADQDPEFKAYFYNTILTDLKKAGKTVIAITHDDHYFHSCDRLLKMNAGQCQELQRNIDTHQKPVFNYF